MIMDCRLFDADVLVNAITDACLAPWHGDIGSHFPPAIRNARARVAIS